MPITTQTDVITGLVRDRLPEVIREDARIECVRSPISDSYDLGVMWSLPDGRRYHAVEQVDARELERLPDSTQADVVVRVIARLVENINRMNRETIEGLITRFGVTLNRLEGLRAWSNQGLASPQAQAFYGTYSNQGVGLQSQLTANQGLLGQLGQQYRYVVGEPPKKTPPPEPEPRSAWERIMADDLIE